MELWKDSMPYKIDGIEFTPRMIEFAVENPKALIVICPGGGYGALCEHEGEKYAQWLNDNGFSAFVLKYRLEPYSGYAMCSDVQRAMRIARKYADDRGIKYVGIMGSSAGGHLTGVASVHYDKRFYEPMDDIDKRSARPDFSVFCYPVIDMFKYTHQGTANIITNYSQDEKIKEFYSINLQVNENTPPAFFWHTASDDSVPVENSILYTNELSKHKIPYEMHIFPYGVHGMGLSEEDEYIGQWKELLIKWLTKFIIK